ncbi:hypothetical protein [uncultured Pontibacter sp.]|uniref:hypothetical protein n=1 Tax=uncultured Pontibacter sp. TaxID=453356 RepID=UPI0026269AD9|nr:hypothetical protein [uncultured Pontibacter sp.]
MATNKKIKFDIEGFNQANKEVKELTDRLGQLHTEFSKAEQGSEEFRKIQKEIAKTSTQLDVARSKVESFNRTKLDKVKGIVSGVRDGFGKLTETVTGTSDSVGLLEQGFAQMGIQNNFLTRSIELLGGKGTKALMSLRMAFLAIPILALLTGIASLVAYFTKTQEGSDRLSHKMSYLSGIFTGLVNVMSRMGKEFADFIEKVLNDPMVLLDAIIEQVKTRAGGLFKIFTSLAKWDMKGVADGFGMLSLGVENATEKMKALGQELNQAGEDAQKINKMEKEFEKLSHSIELSNAKLERQKQYYEDIYKDSTRNEKEREAAFKKANAAEDGLFANRIKLASAEYKLIKGRNALSDSSRKDIQAERMALDKISAIRAEMQRDEIADGKEISAFRREQLKILISTQKEAIEELISANEELISSDEKTYQEKRTLIQENYKAQKELVALQLQEIDNSDKSLANQKLIAKLKSQASKVEEGEKKRLKALDDEYNKKQETAATKLEELQRQRQKLAADSIRLDETTLDAFIQTSDRKIAATIGYYNTELEAEKQKYEKAKQNKQLSDKELLALEQEYLLKKEQLEKASADAVIALEDGIREKRKEVRDSDLAAMEKTKELYKNAYSEIATTVSNISNNVTRAAVSMLDARLTELDDFLSEANNRLSEIDAEANTVQSNINGLENSLLKARGDERERIIRQLEQERKKETELAMQRKQEDARIKKAEQEKIRLEEEKDRALQKQTQTQQKLAAIQAGMVAVESTLAGIEAAKAISKAAAQGKVGWDNIAILLAMTAATVGSLATIKSATKGFAEGGYTGDGGKYQEAGIVHKGEYVIPQWMVKQNKSLISSLEAQRTRGYAEGGSVAAAMADSVNPNAELVARLDAMNAMLNANLNKPIYTVATEVAEVNARVTSIKETALK